MLFITFWSFNDILGVKVKLWCQGQITSTTFTVHVHYDVTWLQTSAKCPLDIKTWMSDASVFYSTYAARSFKHVPHAFRKISFYVILKIEHFEKKKVIYIKPNWVLRTKQGDLIYDLKWMKMRKIMFL